MFFEWFGFLIFWLLIGVLLQKLIKGLWTSWIGYYLGFGVKWRPGPKSWAVITGSTDGIGLQYAIEFAKIGYSLLLISRNDEKLQNTKELILSKSNKCHNIKTLATDFSQRNVYDKIEEEIEEIEELGQIDVLINNVGMSLDHAEYFSDIPDREKFINHIINVNILSATKLTQIIMPRMVDRDRGVIMNISSILASYPVPLLAIYSATKVYLDYFTRAIHYEYKDKGIMIQSVKPGVVSTKMNKARPSFLVSTVFDYVNNAMMTVGIEHNTYGYWTHKLIGFFMNSIIGFFFGSYYQSLIIFNYLKKLRIRYWKII